MQPVLGRVLVVDDEEALAELIASALGDAGYDVGVAHSLAEAGALLDEREFDVALLDMHLPDGNGTEVLRRLVNEGAATEVVMLTGNRDVASAVEVMKLGASDYLVKPTPLADLEHAVARAKDRHRLRTENVALRARLERHETRSAIVTEDPDYLKVIGSLAQVGPSDLPVIIAGESGTGRELLAQAVHDASHHKMEPFVAFSCAGLSDEILERELFGYERGAFSGADERKPGVFEVVDRGTLFLDDIGELSAAMQPRLLRVIEDQEFSRVGSTRPLRSRARFVFGATQDLEGLVASGRFRKDLHYRINGVTLRIKPLRERPGDILPLSLHFIRVHGIRRKLAPRALDALKAYPWPGNVRELQMVIQRAGALATGDLIEPRDLPFSR
jgi:DNA-binding NtrC family response regulator